MDVKDLGMKFIYRTKRESWHVAVRLSDQSRLKKSVGLVQIQKVFSDMMFGGKANSLLVARLYRDATYLRLLEKATKHQRSDCDNRGVNNGNHKVTPQDVAEIRRLKRAGSTLSAIAEIRSRLGLPKLSLKGIAKIATGEKWGYLPGAVPKRWIRGTRGYANGRQVK